MSIDLDAIDLSSLAFWRRDDRIDALAALRRERPVSWHEMTEPAERGMRGFWAVTRYADVVGISSRPQLFVSGESTYMGDHTPEEALAEGWFLNMDAPRHTMLRQVVQRAFSPAQVARMRETAARHADRLVRAVRDRGACDFAHDVAQPYPVEVVCDFLGAPQENRARLRELTMIALAGDGMGEAAFAAIPAAFAELNDYGATLARERRRRPEGDDILSLIVNAEVDGRRLDDREAGMFFQLLVTAGMETTGTAGGHLLRVLLDHPAQLAAWRDDPAAIAPTGVEEIVRYVSPIMYMRRTAAADTVVAGQKIAAGDKVILWYVSANRDEARFDRPDAFDVRRKPNPHVGFGGGGRHTCLGAHLARLELPILIGAVLRHLRDVEPDGAATTIPSRFVNGLAALPIRYAAA